MHHDGVLILPTTVVGVQVYHLLSHGVQRNVAYVWWCWSSSPCWQPRWSSSSPVGGWSRNTPKMAHLSRSTWDRAEEDHSGKTPAAPCRNCSGQSSVGWPLGCRWWRGGAVLSEVGNNLSLELPCRPTSRWWYPIAEAQFVWWWGLIHALELVRPLCTLKCSHTFVYGFANVLSPHGKWVQLRAQTNVTTFTWFA